MNKNRKNQDKNLNLLSENAVKIWRIRATLLLIAASFFDGAVAVFWSLGAIIFGTAVIILYLLVFFVYCPMLYSVSSYSVEQKIITVDKGFFIHKHIKMNFSKIQYCVISQGPVQKIYGLCSIMLLTAGSAETIYDISVINAQKIKISVEE